MHYNIKLILREANTAVTDIGVFFSVLEFKSIYTLRTSIIVHKVHIYLNAKVSQP